MIWHRLSLLLLLLGLSFGSSAGFADGMDQAFIRPSDTNFAQRLLARAGFGEIEKSYALVVGINLFDDFDELPTANDPIRVKDFLIDEAGFDHVHLLTGDKVTKARLEELMLDEFRQEVGAEDRFLFYWSGHGFTIGQGAGERGFLPLKTSGKTRISTMVSMDDISDWDGYIEARQVLYLLDSCFSGLVGAAPQSDLEQIARDQLSGPSRHVITAGRGDEQTIAVDQLGGSVFTHALLKGLRGAADSANALGNDNLVSVGELKLYLGQEVTRLRNRFGWQRSITPQIRDLRGSDGAFFFPVANAFPVNEPPPPPDPNAQVKEVQQALIDLGYDPGPVDGQLSIKTKTSLIQFQRDQGLEMTGEIDEATLERLPFALAGLVQTLGGDQGDTETWDDTGSTEDSAIEETTLTCQNCPKLVSVLPERDYFDAVGFGVFQSPKPYFLSETEVTTAQFKEYAEETNLAFVETKTSDGPSCFAWQTGDKLRKTSMAFNLNGAPDEPVSCVSRDDALGYIAWLNEQNDGPDYRLPTSLEFHYALVEGNEEADANHLRQIVKEELPVDRLCKIGNLSDASSQFSWRNQSCTDGHSGVAPVKSFEPNNLGIYDLTGNLWEWIAECASEPASNALSDCKSGLLKGASFDDPVKNADPDTQQSVPADRRQTNIGFRIARDLE